MGTFDRTAYVYVRDAFAGTLQETDSGYSFRYEPGYLENPEAPSVSLTLPKRSEEYTSAVLFSFFDGLIPEGWLLNIVTQNWKIDPTDRFGLLLVACEDCIGCVRIREERS
ncbi:MAG: HipA N-terminal domain-containing protein [Clostridiales bacterium]|nr:HipA N-terminal domain-containing protein [Clostridiales bacterium]